MSPQDRQHVQKRVAEHKRAKSPTLPTQPELSAQPGEGAHHQLGSCKGRLLWKSPYSLLHPLRELSEGQLTVNSIVYNKNKPSSAHSTQSLSLVSFLYLQLICLSCVSETMLFCPASHRHEL